LLVFAFTRSADVPLLLNDQVWSTLGSGKEVSLTKTRSVAAVQRLLDVHEIANLQPCVVLRDDQSLAAARWDLQKRHNNEKKAPIVARWFFFQPEAICRLPVHPLLSVSKTMRRFSCAGALAISTNLS
jgi:hypothetical protein